MIDLRRWDLIWVDKGMFISNQSFQLISESGNRNIFFTPDTLFWQNSSKEIHASLHLFDVVCTTKSFEVETFLRFVPRSQLLLLQQGFSAVKGEASKPFGLRTIPIGFVGKFERHRGDVVKQLLFSGVSVHVAGIGWKRFSEKLNHANLFYLGETLRGSDYQGFYENTKIGLGLLSKEFPELHTTRTFEIPYFGAVLASERTPEVVRYFDCSNALLYSSITELVTKVHALLKDNEGSAAVALKGNEMVSEGRFSWEKQIMKALERAGHDEESAMRPSQHKADDESN